GVDGIGGLETTLIVSLSTVGRKLLRLSTVEIGEGPSNRITGSEVPLLRNWLKETPSYDLEALLSAGRSPCGLKTTERVAQAHNSLTSTLTTNFNVRGRDAGNEQCFRGCLGSFSEGLSE